MQNPLTLPTSETAQRLLNLVGGDPLDGSGFENEQSDSAFVANDITDASAGEA